MSNKIEDTLRVQDDFKLCNELFKVLDYRCHHDISRQEEGEISVVLLVWHSYGILGNGGFHYLFEGDFEGDHDLVRTLVAFDKTDASQCAEAIREALALFPDSKPPSDIPTRLMRYESHDEIVREAIDSKFYDHSKEIPKLLATYIRKNSDKYLQLDRT